MIDNFSYAFLFQDSTVNEPVLFLEKDGKKTLYCGKDISSPSREIATELCHINMIKDVVNDASAEKFIKNKFAFIKLDNRMSCFDISPNFLEEMKIRAFKVYVSAVNNTLDELIKCMKSLKRDDSSFCVKVGEDTIYLTDEEARILLKNKINNLKELLK